MGSDAPKILRCAIYTRKSSEEGLEQAFNSLDAQREACAAFTESQRHEGWRLVKTLYDDGGHSGGTMERPALKRLLKDIDDRAIDVVVVYKVDRLTRSLADFAKIVEIFDAHRVSFVSVTQQFNTTTSMGRLTLNVLLSFAQFEREVTGERIRDKIAASKRKGMWMGGCVPLGYDVDGRQLVINGKEAKIVRYIFKRYLALGCVAKLQLELKAKQIKSKVRVSKNTGRTSGGQTYSRGALYSILQNQLYRGAVAHRGVIYPGQHAAIIGKSLWEAVQQRLQTNSQARRNGVSAEDPSLLSGLLFDDRGNRLTPCHTLKQGKRYRYYVSQAVIHRRTDQLGHTRRVPAHDIETIVTERLLQLLKTPIALLDALSLPAGNVSIKEALLSAAKDRVNGWADTVSTDLRRFLLSTISKVIIQKNAVTLMLSRTGLRETLLNGTTTPLKPIRAKHAARDQKALTVKTRLKRGGREVRLIVPATEENAIQVNPSLVKAIVRGHYWYEQLLSGKAESVTAIAKANRLNDRYVTRIVQCAFLAPDIIEAILAGRQPIDLTLDKMRTLPIDWKEQRRILGFYIGKSGIRLAPL